MHKCNNKKPHFKTILSKPDIFNGTDAYRRTYGYKKDAVQATVATTASLSMYYY